MKSLPLKFNLAKAKATRIEKNVPPMVVKNATKIVLKFRLRHFCSVLSLVTKNRNKNVLEEMTLAKHEEDISIKITTSIYHG
jgi:hypothetical protein